MQPDTGPRADALELTVLMPCLNEAETLATCIDKAKAYLSRANIAGEVLIADNGSTDGSIEIAKAHGARVVHVPVRGYGAALRHGIENAHGKFVIMGDSDDSYDFSRLDPFVEKLREGYDFVIGNRFKGGIADGAMPFLHRYLGNPVLSFLGRLFFRSDIGDFHCGLRGFRREAINALGLKAPGMEFASEMVVRASLGKLRIAEVPTTLSPDGRSRPPHLRTWTDGWRHLRYLLLNSPKWLFVYPGAAILAFGALLTIVLLQGPVQVLPGVVLDTHSLIVGCMAMLVGASCLSFGVIARSYSATRGFLPVNPRLARVKAYATLERTLMGAGALALVGLTGLGYAVWQWAAADFGALEYNGMVRMLTVSCTLIALGLQLAFAAFLAALIDIET
ncbi:dolichol-P-glucose synthetase [Aquibium oceanicum]|uniref:Dolichol-P-glucose synthetase n=2 Tax=Aquibium oceanicum TaxID=1670800 RepID=A0A1L3SLB8_9HYPH|nr:dolichol-P-glucose synthetase [Aquibium oceanicum]